MKIYFIFIYFTIVSHHLWEPTGGVVDKLSFLKKKYPDYLFVTITY